MWSTLELREIRVFLTVAEELHFGRAAERLNLTPSRVSQTIRSLETRLGGRLFDRTSRQVKLTALGVRLVGRMSPAYESMRKAFEEAREESTGVAGQLRIGTYAPVNYGPYFLEIVKTFEARHPECQVLARDTGMTRDQFDWLRRDELDLLAMRLPLTEPELMIGPILSHESRIIIVAKDHPLASKESVSIEDLADYTLPSASGLPPEMLDAFVPRQAPSGRPLRRVETPSLADGLVRVATGEFVHPTVSSFLDHYHHPGVTGVPIRDLPASETALVWLKGKENRKIQAFARAAAEVVASREDERLGPAKGKTGSSTRVGESSR
jgi:DNA-binding transcriptional LysR family regulator